MATITANKEQAMTTTQISTRAAIIRHAIILASRFDDNHANEATWKWLFDRHGAEAMGDANCYLPSDFNAIVDMAREAILTGIEH